ncbi:hypothetical protein [Leifsonia aquatica]|uniref:hypothetical protein n=1 Tax=Leifsonia aquatica TaxID=144185 RepID=UPI0028A7A026|nr:hypothetical protein [Leifsonia aquatica]
MVAGTGAGCATGITYSLLITLPQWLWPRADVAPTGSLGLTIFGGIVGASIGLIFGLFSGAIVYGVCFFMNDHWNRRTSWFPALIGALVSGAIFVVTFGVGDAIVLLTAAAIGLLAFALFLAVGFWRSLS